MREVGRELVRHITAIFIGGFCGVQGDFGTLYYNIMSF
jgi:hypothetical protein